MKTFKNYLKEEVFYWYIIKGTTQKGKVWRTGTEKEMKLLLRKPTTPSGYVLAKSRKDLSSGAAWKGSMGVSEEVELDEILKPGAKVKVPHPAKGKGMVTGKIVRYDKGGPHSPFYVVDIGEPRSEKIPAHKIKEEVELDEADKAYPATIETLKMIVKEKQNQILKFKDGKARYELNDDHNHLIDIKTGNIIEFTSEEIENIQKKIAEKHGYKLVDSKLELYCVKDKSD